MKGVSKYVGYVEELRAIVGHRPLILVGAVVVLVDADGRILLQKRTSPPGVWGLPGGLMELGESAEETARREVKEETGLTVGKIDLIGVFSGPDYFVKVDNGDEFFVVTIAYSSKEFKGQLAPDETEGYECAFTNPTTFPERMVGSHRRIIQTFLQSAKSEWE